MTLRFDGNNLFLHNLPGLFIPQNESNRLSGRATRPARVQNIVCIQSLRDAFFDLSQMCRRVRIVFVGGCRLSSFDLLDNASQLFR